MKMVKVIGSGLLVGMMILGSGCGMFDSTKPAEDTSPIPGAESVPRRDGGLIIGDPGADELGKWGPGAGADFLGGQPGEWEPVPNLSFPTVYFAYDQDVIGVSERPKLQQVADYLNSNSSLGLIVEGHCDERGSAEYNRALGERRAIAVKNYLVNLGIAENRVKTISYGEERPAVHGSTPEAFAKNRRGELIPARMR